MIEQKLIVGRFLNLTINSPKPAGNQGNFVTQASIAMTIQESTGSKVKTSNVVLGTGHKAHRNFQWLHWVPGSICQVPFNGLDVLTGPMSGCYITNYRIGGQEYVGHIGTDMGPNTPNSIAAKACWNNFATAHPLDVLGGFKPAWIGALPPTVNGDTTWGLPTVFGLVTMKEYYTLVTYPQQNAANIYRIAGLQKNPSVPLITLQNL